MGAAFSSVIKSDGASALLAGLAPTTIGYFQQGALKFSLFELFRNHIDPVTFAQHSMLVNVGASAAAECVASAVLCPWEAVRIEAVSKTSHLERGTLSIFSTIYKRGGIGSFYVGLLPILLKQVPYTVTQLTVFSESVGWFYSTGLKKITGDENISKEKLPQYQQLAVSLIFGVLAGVTSSIVSHPADTVLTKINIALKKQIAAEEMGQPRGSRPTVSAIVKELGFRGLWLGVGTRCVFTGALSAIMFLIYDSVKLAAGLPTSSK